MRKGFFICIEGLDGSGKTTQAKLLVKHLQEKHDAICTAEPSQGRIGKLIREYFLHAEQRGSIIVEALLFAADRYEHLRNEVLPALDEGKIIVSDRYLYSSLAYQGAAGVDLDWILAINRHAVKPDLAIFIDVKPEVAIQRLKPRQSVMENLNTQRLVREVYLGFVKKGAMIRIAGDRSLKQVAAEIMSVVSESLEKAR